MLRPGCDGARAADGVRTWGLCRRGLDDPADRPCAVLPGVFSCRVVVGLLSVCRGPHASTSRCLRAALHDLCSCSKVRSGPELLGAQGSWAPWSLCGLPRRCGCSRYLGWHRTVTPAIRVSQSVHSQTLRSEFKSG